MANNRLYIRNKKTGEQVCLAKSLGDGWYLWSAETLVERLANLLDLSDDTSFGNPRKGTPTVFEVYDENNEPPYKIEEVKP